MTGQEQAGPAAPAVRRTLNIAIAEGMLHATMVGVAESYLGALAVELGHRDRALALLATLPLLLGSSAQLLAGPLVTWLGGRKRLVVLGALTQALSHVGFGYIAWSESPSFAALLTTKSIYWISGMLIGPPWGAWMSSLIEGSARARYFAWRSAAVHSALLVAFGSAGFLLWRTQVLGRGTLATFALLNLVAVVARSLSAAALLAQSEPTKQRPGRRYRWAKIRVAIATSEWRPTLYMALLMIGTHCAVPFFTPYMLRELKLDYAHYAALSAVPIVTKAIVSPLLYPLARVTGMRRLLGLSTALISLVALVWSLASSAAGLVLAQVLSGIAWGAFEYTSYQLLLGSARRAYQVEFLSLANSVIGVAQITGALIGAQLLSHGTLDYPSVFLLSAVGRALPIVLVLFFIPVRVSVIERLFWRVLSVRPAGGTVRRPILPADPSLPREPDRPRRDSKN